MSSFCLLKRLCLALALIAIASPVWAQRIRFPSAGDTSTTTYVPPSMATYPPPVAANGAIGWTAPTSPILVAQAPATVPGPGIPGSSGAILGAPSFDGYSTVPGGAANVAPALPGAPPVSGAPLGPGAGTGFVTPGAPSSYPYALPPGQAVYGQPGGVAPYSQPYYGQPLPPAYPGVPQQPPYYFPNGIMGQTGPIDSTPVGQYLRLFQDFGFRVTWVKGGDGADVDMVDNEVSVTGNFPNFLFSGQPLAVTPTFIFHLWDGPAPPSTADLPSKAYSGFINFGWDPWLTPQIGGELDVSFGAYSDFQTFNSDSFRIVGKGLLVLQLTPTLAIKGGVEYLDRLNVKLLPAGGVLWTPNPQTYFDIYFPRPKLAHYLTTLGNTDIWIYAAGEYGGGNWTVERTGPPEFSDRVDINDIRLIGGLEWFSKAVAIKGFVEAGYVFEREVIYDVVPADNFDPSDTFMLRGGLYY